jgi:fumarate reductase subunit D
MLFGAGGAAAAAVLPALFFAVAVAAPLGWISPEAISHHRMYGLAANPIARLVLAAVISLTFWHSAHHLRHFAIDLGLRRVELLLCYVLYGLALAGTVAAVAAVAAL